MKVRYNNGVTLVALAITILVMIIIASIGVYAGTETIQRANLESKKTNMLLIQGKAKEYVEKVNYRFGVMPEDLTEEQKNSIRSEIYENEGKLQKVVDAGITIPDFNIDINKCYYVTSETLEIMGLNKISLDKNEKYYVEFDEENIKVEVYSTNGFQGKYSLTDIDNIKL